MKDERGDDFLVVSLPVQYIKTPVEREAWQEYWRREFSFPVVIAFGDDDDPEWTLEGQARLVAILKDRKNIDDLPWQIIPVQSSEHPPITY